MWDVGHMLSNALDIFEVRGDELHKTHVGNIWLKLSHVHSSGAGRLYVEDVVRPVSVPPPKHRVVDVCYCIEVCNSRSKACSNTSCYV